MVEAANHHEVERLIVGMRIDGRSGEASHVIFQDLSLGGGERIGFETIKLRCIFGGSSFPVVWVHIFGYLILMINPN